MNPQELSDLLTKTFKDGIIFGLLSTAGTLVFITLIYLYFTTAL